MMIRFVLAMVLGVLWLVLSFTTPSFAKSVQCERFKTSNVDWHNPKDFDTWFRQKVTISVKKFDAVPGQKSLVSKQTWRITNGVNNVPRTYTLFPNGEMLSKVTRFSSSAKYKCNMKPKGVLAAQIKKSAQQKCLDGEDILTSCTNKNLCKNATIGQWVNSQQLMAWKTSEKWEKFVTAAKARGLDCGVVEASSQSTHNPASFKLNKAKLTCTELGFTPGTERYGTCVLKVMDY